MPYDAYQIENSGMQFYERPALGYEVILFVQPGISRSVREGRYLGIHPTLSTVIEYRYGSRYSYPPATEAEARQQAIMYCMTAAENHWSRTETRLDARIYPFGGMIRDMRLIPPRRR